jgi:hypothetical protein
MPQHQQQRVRSAAARFRLPDFERSKEQLELLQIGIDPQEEKLRQQQQNSQLSSGTPTDATLAAGGNDSTASPAVMMARRVEEVLANKNVQEVRRVLHERGNLLRAATAAASVNRSDDRRGRLSLEGVESKIVRRQGEPHTLLEEAPVKPVTVTDILRRRQENWSAGGQPRPLSTTTTTTTTTTTVRGTIVLPSAQARRVLGGDPLVSRATNKVPPRGCTPTAADPLTQLEDSVSAAASRLLRSDRTRLAASNDDYNDNDSHHLPQRPATSTARLSMRSQAHSNDASQADDDHFIRRIRRPQSVGGTWDHSMPHHYHSTSLLPTADGSDEMHLVKRLLEDTHGVACSDIADVADEVFDLAAADSHQLGDSSSDDDDGSSAAAASVVDEGNSPLYTHDDLTRMKLEIQRFELSEELAGLVSRRVALQQIKEQKAEQRAALRRAAEDNICAYDENRNLVVREMEAQWAAHRKKLDDERAAVRLRQLPVVNGVVRKKFLLPKFPSPWALIDVESLPPKKKAPESNQHNMSRDHKEVGDNDDEEYEALLASAIVSPNTKSRPGSSSSQRLSEQQQHQQQDPLWKRELNMSQQKQGPMRSQSASTIVKRKRAIDRKRLAAMPDAQRHEFYLMRVAEFNRHVTRIEPDARDVIMECEGIERAAMIALLHDGLMQESRQRRVITGMEQQEWHHVAAFAAGELRSLQAREWAPIVFADKQRQEQRALAEIASSSERQIVLEAANEAHRRNIRAVWDKTFELRAQLLTVQRQTLSKKDEIRFARSTVGDLSTATGTRPIPGVSVTRAEVAATGAAQRLQILELQLGMLEDKQVELRRSIDVLQQTTW